MTLRTIVLLAGWAHLLLVPVGLAVPVVLDWRKEIGQLRPFLQRLFWTYGAFILLTNVGFAAITVLGADDIVTGSRLSAAFCGFVSLYWILRLLVQYAYFDWSDFPSGPIHRIARGLLDLLFLLLAVVYGVLCVRGWVLCG